MSPASVENKRAMISNLTAEELRGWYAEVIVHRTRQPFDGEVVELMNRAKRLGLTIKGR